ncbi:MAG: zinc ribbon domain-containing protein [archaeon]
MSEQTTEIRCKDCGLLLDENPGAKIEDRKPCPGCGSSTRSIYMSIEDRVVVSDSISSKLKSPGIKKPVIETISGSELYKRENILVNKERIIDRKHNRYHEKVVDPKTGEIIHEVEEPLSDHRKHGNAKFQK